jgi:hypothetical protein
MRIFFNKEIDMSVNKTFNGTRGKVNVIIEDDCTTTVTAFNLEDVAIDQLVDRGGHPSRDAITQVVRNTGASGTQVYVAVMDAIRQKQHPC